MQGWDMGVTQGFKELPDMSNDQWRQQDRVSKCFSPGKRISWQSLYLNTVVTAQEVKLGSQSLREGLFCHLCGLPPWQGLPPMKKLIPNSIP